MAQKKALQNIFGTQEVGVAIFEISPPPLLKVGAQPLPSPPVPPLLHAWT